MSSSHPLIRPEFPPTEHVAADYAAITASGRFSNFGPFEQRFRAGIGRRLGVDGVATYSSATTGLIAAIGTLMGRGDGNRRVILPSFTFAAAVQAIELLDFVPVFVDIEPGSLGVDPERAREAIADGPVAGLLFANPFGIGSPLVSEWERLASEAALPLVIDSAAGFGSEYPDGTPIGGRGDAEVFSFHATKPLAVGEGGAVTSRDADIGERLRSASNFGFDGGRESVRMGFNGKLSEFAAALGVRQLERIDRIVEARREVLGWYRARLGAHSLPSNVERSSLAFLPVVLAAGAPRDELVGALAGVGVEARTYYAPSLHRHPRFADVPRGPLEVTEDVEQRILSLPVHSGIDEGTVEEIARVLGGATGIVDPW